MNKNIKLQSCFRPIRENNIYGETHEDKILQLKSLIKEQLIDGILSEEDVVDIEGLDITEAIEWLMENDKRCDN